MAKARLISVTVDRQEGDDYVLTCTYENGVKEELKVAKEDGKRYDYDVIKKICTYVFGRHHLHSLTALQKEELILMIETAILKFLNKNG